MLADDLKIRKRIPAADRTWTRFKTNFSLSHQELRENAVFDQGAFAQANKVAHDEEIASAMANFATAAAADRTTVETLTATVQSLTTELAAVNAQLVTALAITS